MTAATDAELVLAARTGDADSFLTLCERHCAGMVALRLIEDNRITPEQLAELQSAQEQMKLKGTQDPAQEAPGR